jgi:demethylmenaquinone methyltransferase / 2-methoxy-6-polyprenyl-1,4-benzoquinol methylase
MAAIKYATTPPDSAAVNAMFGRIAGRYDLANRLLSGGLDRLWRRRLVEAVRQSSPDRVLDLATGSGDVAFALARSLPPGTRIRGVDFCLPMLAEAEKKRSPAGAQACPNLSFSLGDAFELPFSEGAFDSVTLSFGLRNMSDRSRCLAEIRRVLRPGGRLFVLEFSQPRPWLKPAYFFYLRNILPLMAGWVTNDRTAYEYLNRTIEAFPDADALAAEFRAAGLELVKVTRLNFGIVALHEGSRPIPGDFGPQNRAEQGGGTV